MSASLSPPPFAPGDRCLVTHSVVNLYLAPSRASEQVSQTVMGHAAMVVEAGDGDNAGWARVETDDTYRGWLETRWLTKTKGDSNDAGEDLCTIGVTFARVRGGQVAARLPVGARVVRAGESDVDGWMDVCAPGGQPLGSVRDHALSDSASATPAVPVPQAASVLGAEFLGTPYLWGGSSPFGLDCSGFVQLCYRLAGPLVLRRDADQQRDDPRFVPVDGDNFAPGDLLFFGRPDKITHVALCQGDGHFIHAAGGAGVIVTPWRDDRYSPGFVDARRLDPARAHEPVTRVEASDR